MQSDFSYLAPTLPFCPPTKAIIIIRLTSGQSRENKANFDKPYSRIKKRQKSGWLELLPTGTLWHKITLKPALCE